MTPELPPLHWVCVAPTPDGRLISLASEESIEARERILLARIKSLEAINENNLAEAAARIVDLEAVLSETVSLYGKPGGPWNIPGDPGGWLGRARAAIDAARGEK